MFTERQERRFVSRHCKWGGRCIAGMTLVVVVGLCFWQMVPRQDPGRTKAIELYDSLTPGMEQTDVFRILSQAGGKTINEWNIGIFPTDSGLTLVYIFDNDGKLSSKALYDLSVDQGQTGSWYSTIRVWLRMRNEKIVREWP